MRQVADTIDEIADLDVPVLVEGEPGTGRELIARVIHLSSARRLQDFVSRPGLLTEERNNESICLRSLGL